MRVFRVEFTTEKRYCVMSIVAESMLEAVVKVLGMFPHANLKICYEVDSF
jgi:hypothetical protein